MKSIILCADDFGQNTAISEGILALVAKQRLSAVSCMTNVPGWSAKGPALVAQQNITVGLHFNLTFGAPLTLAPSLSQQGHFFSLPHLLVRCLLHHITLAAAEQELRQQLDAFYQVAGRLPDFIDGHQHVHQFPILRDALLKVYQETLQGSGCYIRQTLTTQGPFAKKRWIINHTGAHASLRQLQQAHIPHNHQFAGIYDFRPQPPYRQLFQSFCQNIDKRGLIMCHPGFAANDSTDPIGSSRKREYDYFASDAFLEDCQQLSIQLTTTVSPA